jgi:hypothetical protein
VSVHGAQLFSEKPAYELWNELELTYQFLDDEDFADDGNPGAGDWTQVRGGLKWSLAPESRRRWTHRAGLFWFRALGEPNVLSESGDYLGLYYGFGYETRATENWTFGPELTLLFAAKEGGTDEFALVPQLAWRVSFSL